MEVFGVMVTMGHITVGIVFVALAVIAWLLVLLQEAAARKLRSIDKKQAIANLGSGASKAFGAIQAETMNYAPVAKRHTSAVWERVIPHFSFAGRVDRTQFIKSILGAAGCCLLLMSLGLWLLDFRGTLPDTLGMMVLISGLALYLWLSSAACAKRTRDTGVNVWWVLTLFIPPVNLAATIFLFFVPTDEFAGRGL